LHGTQKRYFEKKYGALFPPPGGPPTSLSDVAALIDRAKGVKPGMNIGLYKVPASVWRKCFYQNKSPKSTIPKESDNSSLKGLAPVASPSLSVRRPKDNNESEALDSTNEIMDNKDHDDESKVFADAKSDDKEDTANA